jgi:hypothetical protein
MHFNDIRLSRCLIIGCYTVWMWAMLPTFRRYMLPSSSGSTLNVGIFVSIHMVGQPKNITDFGGPFIISLVIINIFRTAITSAYVGGR